MRKQSVQPTAKGHVIDELDAGLDLLITAHLALYADGWIADGELENIRATIEQGLKRLKPVREAVNIANGEGRI